MLVRGQANIILRQLPGLPIKVTDVTKFTAVTLVTGLSNLPRLLKLEVTHVN
jgi:hypothetical protein